MTQTLGPDGHVVTPKAVRDRSGLRADDEVVVSSDEHGAVMQPAGGLIALKGRLAGTALVEALEADRRREPR